MNKILTLLAVIAISNFQTFGQFTLTPEGIVSETEPTKTFVVLTIDGTDAETNYANAKKFVMSFYNSPMDVMSEGDNMMTINGVASQICKVGAMNTPLKILYTMVLEFRENRIKVDFRLIYMNWDNAGQTPLPLKGGMASLYNNKGEIPKNRSDVYDKILEVPNGLVEVLEATLKGNDKNDEW